MRRTTGTTAWGLLLILSTGCATIIRQAIVQDMKENSRRNRDDERIEAPDEETTWVCPPGKVQIKGWRTIPCKVMCEEPKDATR